MPELELYYRPSCPFCQKVLNKLDGLGKTEAVKLQDVTDEEIARELEEQGGKKQVPCLMINGSPLYESAEIIDWLENNL